MARSEVDWEFSSSELSAFWYAYLCHAFWFDLSAPHNPTLHKPRSNFPCASCAQKHSQTRPGTKFRSQGTCRTSVAHMRSGDQRQAVIKCCISEELIWKLIFQLAGKIRGWTAKPCFTLGLECLCYFYTQFGFETKHQYNEMDLSVCFRSISLLHQKITNYWRKQCCWPFVS